LNYPICGNYPYYILDDAAGNKYNGIPGMSRWDASISSGAILMQDYPTASQNLPCLYFETYIVATNYNNSGQDLILGNFSWGFVNGSSLTGTQPIFTPGNYISQPALDIIKNDFPNFNFYNGH
jgi:hypothetical protein